MKKVIGYFIDKILKFSETVNEKEWGKRMQEKPEFYDFLKKVHPEIDDFQPDWGLSWLADNLETTLKQIAICKVKFISFFVKEDLKECLIFIDPKNYFSKTNFFDFDFLRANHILRILNVIFKLDGSKSEELRVVQPIPVVFFQALFNEDLDFENLNLVFNGSKGVVFSGNPMKSDHLKMSYESLED